MKTILILNHRISNCGVYQFGKRVYELVANSKDINYIYREAESVEEFENIKKKLNPDFIIYNWHRGTMQWLSEDLIVNDKNRKHIFIYHEECIRENYDAYLFFGEYDISKKIPQKLSHLLPRPLLNYEGEYKQNDVITIGSFGFGFWQKGFHTLVTLVNNTFKNAVLNLHLPYSYFGDPTGKQTEEVINECKRLNVDSKTKLNINTDFLEDDELLEFLAGNDMNVFLYTENGEGISSVIDYALSVKRPIAISNCQMFRHIIKNNIIVEKNSLNEILKNGTKPLEGFYESWSIENFRKQMKRIFINV